jgi:predicted SnoaL-like aldol condensation-catalyzing enzyme
MMSTMPNNNNATHKEMAISFLQLIASGKIRAAYARHAAPGFIHHNPYFKGDAESLMQGMEQNEAQFPGRILEVGHALEDGDLVAVHSHVILKPKELELALVHIFRFQNDRIAELWDVCQPLPPDSPNEHGMF